MIIQLLTIFYTAHVTYFLQNISKIRVYLNSPDMCLIKHSYKMFKHWTGNVQIIWYILTQNLFSPSPVQAGAILTRFLGSLFYSTRPSALDTFLVLTVYHGGVIRHWGMPLIRVTTWLEAGMTVRIIVIIIKMAIVFSKAKRLYTCKVSDTVIGLCTTDFSTNVSHKWDLIDQYDRLKTDTTVRST